MSQSSINLRSNEEAFTALLIIATLGFGTLFSVAKAVGNRFVGTTFKKDERGSDTDEVEREPEVTKEQSLVGADSGVTTSIQNDGSAMEDSKDGRSQLIRAEALLFSTQRDHDWEVNFNHIHAWEEDTMNCIQREKARRLGRHPSTLDQRDVSRKQGQDAVLTCDQPTMSQSPQEQLRRPERLSSLDWREINQEKGREAVRAWGQAAIRHISRKKGEDAVRAWEQAMMRRSQHDALRGQERLSSVEEYERIVLFDWSSRRHT